MALVDASNTSVSLRLRRLFLSTQWGEVIVAINKYNAEEWCLRNVVRWTQTDVAFRSRNYITAFA